MVGNISKKAVDALATTGAEVLLWDRELPRFGLKCRPTGVKTYIVQYRAAGRIRRYTIGQHGAPWTPETARKEALRVLGRVAAGEDPAEAKQDARDTATVRQVVERFRREHAEAKRKPTTASEYRRLLEAHILPAFGPRPIAAITRADIAKLHHRLKATPMQANRVLAVLSKMMNLAERWGLRADATNPCRHVERYRERKRTRFLSAEELARFGATLDAAARGELRVPDADGVLRSVTLNPFALAALRLLIFTGARRDEILSLRWEHVDLEHGALRLGAHKTDGAVGAKVVHLNAAARAVLEALPRVEGNPYVIVGGREGRHLVNLKDTWGVIRRAAKLEDVRPHDLRHSFASVGAGSGLALPIIGGLLGHTQPSTTQRYAHLAADPLRQAAELIGERITTAMNNAGSGTATAAAPKRRVPRKSTSDSPAIPATPAVRDVDDRVRRVSRATKGGG